jgi:hypothetical protein
LLDTLSEPTEIRFTLPDLRMLLAIEVEREILSFFTEAAQGGLTIVTDQEETPSEWFISTITKFLDDTARELIQGGMPTRDAVAQAVIDACSYAAPAYYIGRVLQLETGDRTMHRRAVNYLRRHPVQLARLADPQHIDAVPAIAPRLRAVLADALTT